MLLDFGAEIRSCGRLEVGRNPESSEPHEIPQQNIMLNWDFAEALFTATELDPKKTPNCSAHLLPTCINFEFETHFSTTWFKTYRFPYGFARGEASPLPESP